MSEVPGPICPNCRCCKNYNCVAKLYIRTGILLGNRMVLDISSDTSSSGSVDSDSKRLLDEILKQYNIRPVGAVPFDFILPSDPRTVPPFNPRYQREEMEAGEQGNAPEETTGRGRGRRPCKFLHYFSGEPGEFENFCEAYAVPGDVVVRVGPLRR